MKTSLLILVFLSMLVPAWCTLPSSLILSERVLDPLIEEIDIALLFDVSGSISDAQLEHAKQVSRIFLSRKIENSFVYKFAVISFSDEKVVHHNISEDRVSLERGIEGITHTGGGSLFSKALKESASLLNQAALKSIFLFSDGDTLQEKKPRWWLSPQDPDHHDVVVGTLFELSQKDVQVIGFPYGSTSTFLENKLREMRQITGDIESSTSAVRGAAEMLGKLAISRNMLTMPFIQVDAIWQVSYSSIGEPVEILIHISNAGKEDIPKGSKMIFSQNSYFKHEEYTFQKAVRPNADMYVDIKLRPLYGKSFHDLPKNGLISVSFVGPTNSRISSNIEGFFLATEMLIGKLVEYKPVDTSVPALNIILFGPKGSGKSSLINSMLTALSSEIQNYIPVGGIANGTRTKEIIRTPLWNSKYFSQMNANIWDTWGITPTDFNLEFFKKTVRGQVPAGYSIRDWQQGVEQSPQPDVDLSIVSAREKEMHSVLFVLTPEGCKRGETIATISSLNEYAQDLGISPLFIITHADMLDQADVESFELLVAETFKVPVARVFFLYSYAKQKKKSFEIDSMSLELLTQAMGAADTFLKRKVLQEATCDPACKNGGTCVLNKCDCRKTGHVGRICETPYCDAPCKNGGVCLGHNTCECPPWVFGRYCEIGDTQLYNVGTILVGILVVAISSVLFACCAKRNAAAAPVYVPVRQGDDYDYDNDDGNESRANIDEIDGAEDSMIDTTALPGGDTPQEDEDDEVSRIKTAIRKNNKLSMSVDASTNTSISNNNNDILPARPITPLQELKESGKYKVDEDAPSSGQQTPIDRERAQSVSGDSSEEEMPLKFGSNDVAVDLTHDADTDKSSTEDTEPVQQTPTESPRREPPVAGPISSAFLYISTEDADRLLQQQQSLPVVVLPDKEEKGEKDGAEFSEEAEPEVDEEPQEEEEILDLSDVSEDDDVHGDDIVLPSPIKQSVREDEQEVLGPLSLRQSVSDVPTLEESTSHETLSNE